MAKGIDCSVELNAKTAAALYAEGYRFAARYLVPKATKRLTGPEAASITAAGLQIVSVFETLAERSLGGAANGSIDGAEALQQAKLVGQPLGSAIYFAVDYDAQPQHFAAIEAYLRAAAAAIPGYIIGVYGSYAVVEEMAKRGASKHFWQTYAWSRGLKSNHANLYQYQNGATAAGLSVDLDEAIGNVGWWSAK
ncbi:DUF1906 domain-containing protein [Cohnella faecalis]|uniref:DUF1906 domain-containing protein n=1 Tax=Cohnella faecalis TaxID=2315694 RepID=A0A398CJD0_9BACL|nr:DUF1906 domain-containing protein [Cohnella faecalis]RIE02430.1 DUF1906 domain-containing protein [Cohnella faecalis]